MSLSDIKTAAKRTLKDLEAFTMALKQHNDTKQFSSQFLVKNVYCTFLKTFNLTVI